MWDPFEAYIWTALEIKFAESHDNRGKDVPYSAPIFARYEDGKFKKKKNTFTDFVCAAEHLIQKKYTDKSRLCIQVILLKGRQMLQEKRRHLSH